MSCWIYPDKSIDDVSKRGFLAAGISGPDRPRLSPDTTGLAHRELLALEEVTH